MGDVTLIAFGGLAVVGVVLLGFGALRRARFVMMAGAALLLALGGAWLIGLSGVALGLVALALLWRRR